MNWNEEKHPRDKEGKFTFKNGGNNISSASEILYGKIKKEVKEKGKLKEKLLNILGSKATPSDILYGDEKSLVKKIKEYKIIDKLDNLKYSLAIKTNKALGNTLRKPINHFKGEDTTGMLDIASQKKNLAYSRNTIKLKNINVFQENSNLFKYKTYMKNKIQNQFKDFNYDINDINGYVFENNSPQVQRIKESNGFKEIIKQNKNNILNKKRIISGQFIKNSNDKKEKNMYNAFGKIDIFNQGIDKNGVLHLYMFDTYDFNKGESPLIEAGRKEMLNGNLKGFFSIHEITLSKKELNELFK